ncbi:chemotaxis protein CheD [Patescibacteria group bacterium]|nr:chemotaxis protein CheD [Patescibacteria group bacterium]
MRNKVVRTGQIEVAKDDEILEALGIGSCVIVCLYDRSKKLGGMAHIMLPEKSLLPENRRHQVSAPAEFVDDGINNLIKLLQKHGGELDSFEVKLFGGAEMFGNIRPAPESLGTINLNAVKKIIEDLGLEVVSEDVGGNTGRSLKFFLSSGDVEVRKRL